jgi:hypothetical protein
MRRTIEDDDDDDDPYDSDYDPDQDEPDDASFDTDDEDTTTACQYCGAAVYDDAERCPSCGNYLSEEEAPSRFPVWVKITALVCLVVVVMWVLSRL